MRKGHWLSSILGVFAIVFGASQAYAAPASVPNLNSNSSSHQGFFTPGWNDIEEPLFEEHLTDTGLRVGINPTPIKNPRAQMRMDEVWGLGDTFATIGIPGAFFAGQHRPQEGGEYELEYKISCPRNRNFIPNDAWIHFENNWFDLETVFDGSVLSIDSSAHLNLPHVSIDTSCQASHDFSTRQTTISASCTTRIPIGQLDIEFLQNPDEYSLTCGGQFDFSSLVSRPGLDGSLTGEFHCAVNFDTGDVAAHGALAGQFRDGWAVPFEFALEGSVDEAGSSCMLMIRSINFRPGAPTHTPPQIHHPFVQQIDRISIPQNPSPLDRLHQEVVRPKIDEFFQNNDHWHNAQDMMLQGQWNTRIRQAPSWRHPASGRSLQQRINNVLSREEFQVLRGRRNFRSVMPR